MSGNRLPKLFHDEFRDGGRSRKPRRFDAGEMDNALGRFAFFDDEIVLSGIRAHARKRRNGVEQRRIFAHFTHFFLHERQSRGTGCRVRRLRFFRGGAKQDIIIRRLRYKDAFAELRGREKQRVMHEIAAFAIQQDIFALSCADGDFVAEQRRDSAACKPRAVDDDFAADFSAVFARSV